jgi:hypothetical protein
MTTPKTAFYTPSQEERDRNPNFWDGNDLGIPKAMILTFWGKAKSYPEWWNYVYQFYRPQQAWNATNIGYNDAFETATIYLWMNDPTSPHNIVV